MVKWFPNLYIYTDLFPELQKVRQQVVKEIKSNQQLEHDLDQMDVKIGLLIKNRITLQVHSLPHTPRSLKTYKVQKYFQYLISCKIMISVIF